MHVYFDNCAVERLCDSSRTPKIVRQRAAMQILRGMVERGETQLVASTWNYDELEQMSGTDRLELAPKVRQVLDLSPVALDAANGVDIADALLQCEPRSPNRLRIRDALHLGIAVLRQVEVFVTCDERLLKWARTHRNAKLLGKVEILLPQEVVGRMRHATREKKEEE